MTPTRRRSSKTSLAGSLVLLAIVLLVFLFQSLIDQGAEPAPAPRAPSGASAGWYSLYFTSPGDPQMEALRGGPDANLAAAIAQARLSVDLAVYQLNLWSIRDALLDAHRRGVAVRLVTDSDYMDEEEIAELQAAGIPVLGDRREGLMHNKFAVIDRQEVWTGSMNLSVNDAYRNNNNLIRVRSQRLAENYRREFEEMFAEDSFGPTSPNDTPYTSFSVDGTRLEVYFSPEDGTAARLLELVAGARESVYFLAFSFTSDPLAGALIERAMAGVTVAGVMDTGQYQSNQGGEYDNLRAAGLDVRLDGNPRSLHHKVLVIDGRIVVTGSYNFSSSAERVNDENTLVIHNQELAAAFLEEFRRVYEAAGE